MSEALPAAPLPRRLDAYLAAAGITDGAATIDGAEGLRGGCGLPLGALRESPAALAEVDALAIWDGPLSPEDGARIEALAPALRGLRVRRVVDAVRVVADSQPEGFEPIEPTLEDVYFAATTGLIGSRA